ncbi:MFS transporter [Agreia sp. PsM10]|uniref:MFS transporter n=1 Tax=Agreia sp. PsM10 TaxID=3030533 RepID=UPI00263BC6B8|nr:MFS transporter [Agreia sp. PsM10]MDN4640059.1 MFS transporter [Agreia sp. PsM10]
MTAQLTDHEARALDARLDKVPVTSRHILWIVILGAAYFIEIFDNVSFSLLAPAVRAEFELDIPQIGLIISSVFVGALFGAILGGRLSDKIGRKPILIAACLVFSVGSLVSAIAPTWELLALSRIVTGFGMQAAVGVLMVVVSEMFPRLARGRFFAVLTMIGFMSSPVTAVIALNIVPLAPGAWRWVFVIGASGVIVAALIAWFLPETVRWQVSHGRLDAASRTVEALENLAERKGTKLPVPEEVPEQDSNPVRPRLRDLFRGEALRRLVVTSGTFFAYLFCLYGFYSWVPTILVDRGMSQPAALQFVTIMSIAQIIGPLILYPLADRIERKSVILVGTIVTAAALCVFALTGDPVVTLIAASVAHLASTGMTTPFYTYIPEVFPTALRGIGVGMVNGVGRVAGVLSGVVVAAVYTAWGFQVLYLMLAALFVLTGATLFIFGVRTTNRSLEAIAADALSSAATTEQSH